MRKQRPLLSRHIAELATLNLIKDSGVWTQEDLDKFPLMLETAKAELDKYRENLPKPKQPKVSFYQRVTEMKKWAEFVIAKTTEQERLE